MAAPPIPKPRGQRFRTSSEPDVSIPPFPPRSNSEDSGLPAGAPVPKPRACWTNSSDAVFSSVQSPPPTYRAQSIPEHEMYGDDEPAAESTSESSVPPEQELAHLRTQVDQLRKVIDALRQEEKSLNNTVERKQGEARELDTRIHVLKQEEVTLNTKLTRLHERAQEQEEKRSDGRMEERLRERELKVQHREDQVSDRESANRQENLRLQRLADQLHMQKKDLEHREFDLQTYHDEGDRPSGQERAALAERERVVQRREAELNSREQDFDGWRRQQEESLRQRLSQLEQREKALQSRVTGYQPTQPYPPYQQPAPQAATRLPFIPPSTLADPYTQAFTQTHIPMQVPPNSPSHPRTQPQPQPQPRPQLPPQGGPGKFPMPGNIEYGGSQFSPGGHQYGPGGPVFGPGYSGGGYQPVQRHGEPTFAIQRTAKPQVPNPGNPSLAVPIPYQNAGRQNVHYTQGSPAGPSALNDLDSQSPRNDLDTPPLPPRPKGLSSTTRPNVIGDVTGVIGSGAVGGAIGRTSAPTSSARPQINMDEELAHHLSEFVPPAQTREQILSDEEYARQLQEQLAPTDSERDREFALALQAEEFPSGLPDLAQGEVGLQETVRNTLKKQEEMKEQEKRDYQLAQELNDLGGTDPPQLNDLNDLNS